MKKLLAILCAIVSVVGALFFVFKLMGRFCKKGEKLHGVEVPLDGEDIENPAGTDENSESGSEEAQEEAPQA